MANISQISRERFRDWLIANQDKVVGRPCRTASCPLATYMRRRFHMTLHVSFSGGRAVIFDRNDPSDSYYQLPQWATDFAEAFDILVEPGPTEGAIALAILNDVEMPR